MAWVQKRELHMLYISPSDRLLGDHQPYFLFFLSNSLCVFM